MFLLFCLMCVMLPTYLMHNKSGEVSFRLVERMIAGLNSNIFEYLLANEKTLMLKAELKQWNVNRVTSVDFYMTCVQLSRPCSLPGMAKTWPAYESWNYNNNGMEYLLTQYGKKGTVTVYLDPEPFPDFEGISFDDSYKTQTTYQDFYVEMKENPQGSVMYLNGLGAKLKNDVILPTFYDNIGTFKRGELR